MGNELILYLFVSPIAVSAMLIREEDKVQKPVCYVSKALAKTRYLKIEKLAYALLVVVRKLCLITKDGDQRSSMADFVPEFTYDAASDPKVEALEEQDQATNNEAEYEALLARLRVVAELGIESLDAFSDSHLVVNQVQGDYLVKDLRMVDYFGEEYPPKVLAKSYPWPFTQWRIDILRPLPQSTLQRKLLIVAIDYFAKWIEAASLAKIPKKNTKNFVWSDIICRFGIPKVIISDNTRQFDNNGFKLFGSDLAMSNHFSSLGHHRANGKVEVINKTILRNLKARLEKSKGEWTDDLLSMLWAYHTTSRIPTSETPFSMLYGTKLVIPVEIGMPSFRNSNFDKENNETVLRLNLDLLDKKRK
ncbi:hypothetical protein Acr_00g0036940 [Actinidia rufa]|uniref:Integrase catalytic domain-containing protein n=1 Tax=Actinidia rufa TaxID=165716 RepID=A0A7J0DGP8_9ERIC|nr:hypothetical protein Acr_00g0036940 [Actinidia rufa]